MLFQRGRVKNRRKSRLGGFFAAIFILAVCLLAGWIFFWPSWQARLFGVQTQGIVRSVKPCPENNSDVALRSIPFVEIVDHVQPTVQFTDRQGQTHEVVDLICGSYGVGEQVTLWYLPNNPNSISLERDTNTVVIFGIVDVVAIAACLLYIFWLAGRFLFLLVVAARANQPS